MVDVRDVDGSLIHRFRYNYDYLNPEEWQRAGLGWLSQSENHPIYKWGGTGGRVGGASGEFGRPGSGQVFRGWGETPHRAN